MSISPTPWLAPKAVPDAERRQHEGEFLNDLRKRTFRYFLEAADPVTGLIADRARGDGSRVGEVASSAACGFGLAALSVGIDSGLISRGEAGERVRRMLFSLLHQVEHHQGFPYHFVGLRDGRRRWGCEASTIDTALLLAGAMCASTVFENDAEIVGLSDSLIRRANWSAMLDPKHGQLHMGWTPENGLLPHRWDRFSELLVMLLIAIGSDENGVPAECWNAWRREGELTYRGERFLSYPPLFVQQYSLAFFDLRDRRAASGRDFWKNSVTAHHAQIEFMHQLARRYPREFGHYGNHLWGITSSDSVDGYRDWGGPYQDGRIEPDRGIDGTVVPSAAGGGLAIVSEEALRTLMFQRHHFGERVYGRYGFVNAFNPASGWVGPDVIGIDTGITFLMAENLAVGSVWRAFMTHTIAQNALTRTGFTHLAS
ncbi:MAG: glucoamylase family protein [Planctomycetota bacterium]